MQNECAHLSWVFIWKMTPEKVGHVAFQVGGCQPKMTKECESGIYLSLHPARIPAFGPTIALPLPSQLSRCLEDDMEIEASYVTNLISPDAVTFSHPSEKVSMLPPDAIFKIDHLKTDKMEKAIEQIENLHGEGNLSYQLCPRPDSVGFYLDMPTFLTYDFDKSAYVSSRQSIDYYGKHRYNCATMVSWILLAGSLTLKHSKLPWGITPNDVMDQLSNISRNIIPGKPRVVNVQNHYFKMQDLV